MDEPENWLANGMDFGDSKDPTAAVVMDSQAIGTAAAEMAAAWCGLLTSEVAPRIALDCSVAGLATATIVCACPRYEAIKLLCRRPALPDTWRQPFHFGWCAIQLNCVLLKYGA